MTVLQYWPWLLLPVVLFALPLVYIALEVAAAELFDTRHHAGGRDEADEVDEAYLDALGADGAVLPAARRPAPRHRRG